MANGNGDYRRGAPAVAITPYSLNSLAQAAHDTAVEKGFWDGNRNPFEVLALIHSEVAEATECVRKGQWTNEHHFIGKPFEAYPSMRTAEGGKGYEVLMGVRERSGYPGALEEDWRPLTPALAVELGYEVKPVGLPSELADIIIRVLDFAAQQRINMDAAVVEKMEYNATRPHKHGGKAA